MRAVVIGTGPAGITAAETLRRLDPTGTVVALSAESFAPYSPPAMADYYLTGRDSTLYWKGRDVAARLGIDERREAQVTQIDPDNHEVILADGQRVGYEGLVVASGSRLHAPLEGADLPGVLDFKSLRTADELVGRVRSGEATSALVVGNGFIGVELSLLLADLGVAVTVIGRRNWVMPRVLDPLTSTVAETALIRRGVTLRLGVEAAAFIGRHSSRQGCENLIESQLRLEQHLASIGKLEFLLIVSKNLVNSVSIFPLPIGFVEATPMRAAIVPTVVSPIYRFGDMLLEEFDHVKKVVLAIDRCLRRNRPQVVLADSEQDLQTHISDPAFHQPSIDALITERPVKYPSSPSRS